MNHLHVVDAPTLGDQACFLASAPEPALLQPIINRHPCKPHGGLFTSTYLGPELLSDWWLKKSLEMPAMFDGRGLYLLSPADGLGVLVLDTVADAEALFERYGWRRRPDGGPLDNRLDFIAMSRDGYAGLRVTRRGLSENTNCGESPLYLNDWDCESTVWWAWPGDSWALLRTLPAADRAVEAAG